MSVCGTRALASLRLAADGSGRSKEAEESGAGRLEAYRLLQKVRGGKGTAEVASGRLDEVLRLESGSAPPLDT